MAQEDVERIGRIANVVDAMLVESFVEKAMQRRADIAVVYGLDLLRKKLLSELVGGPEAAEVDICFDGKLKRLQADIAILSKKMGMPELPERPPVRDLGLVAHQKKLDLDLVRSFAVTAVSALASDAVVWSLTLMVAQLSGELAFLEKRNHQASSQMPSEMSSEAS